MYLSIDQSTSSTTVFLFDKKLSLLDKISKQHKQITNNKGWVEHNADEIYFNLLKLVKKIIKNFFFYDNIFLSITNQRETFVVFDTYTGKPLCNAIVWQCRRGQKICENLNKISNNAKLIKNITGLKLDTYFPASKLSWLIKNNKNLGKKLKDGSALFGTIDTYLIYRLTNMKSYNTDFTNASRTLFFDNKKLKWNKDLLKLFNLKLKNLPKVKESSSIFGETDFGGMLKKKIPISGVIGDSQSAMFANHCLLKGDTKITLGTGASILTNINNNYIIKNNLLTTLSYVHKGKPFYSYECLINYAGGTISWLKDNLGIINTFEETEKISKTIKGSNGVFLIPAFVGLSNPYWLPDTKGMIYGLTPSVNKKHLIRASLESIGFQIKDYLDDLEKNKQVKLKSIFIDGGMTKNAFLIQLISNLVGRKIYVSNFADMSAYGALLMGLIGMKLVNNIKDLKNYKKEYIQYIPIKKNDDIKIYRKWKEILIKHYINNNT
ncbi:FGGY family carbohydrate kinase [Alphaproteobacteria bacterium]|nr:FGGY family carbohydrate kinase [Alphaproteobacteria bacterium]